ncbi:MAG TPA: DUF2147 domain-containing protein [Hanamia sp.]
MKFFILAFQLLASSFNLTPQQNADDIIGRWMSLKNNFEVEIFRTGNEFKAKIIWFDDTDDTTRPMNERRDEKNPNRALRNQKILGMQVMHGLVYNKKNAVWENGKIYDATSGRTWSATLRIMKNRYLKVRGYWHFQFLGQNLFFKRVL